MEDYLYDDHSYVSTRSGYEYENNQVKEVAKINHVPSVVMDHIMRAVARDGIDVSSIAVAVPCDEPQRETMYDRFVREADELENTIISMTTKLNRRHEQIARLREFPAGDPCEDTDMLRFEKTYPNSDKAYMYAAVRVDGLYHLTGDKSPDRMTWSELVEWMGVGVDPKQIDVISGRNRPRKMIGRSSSK